MQAMLEKMQQELGSGKSDGDNEDKINTLCTGYDSVQVWLCWPVQQPWDHQYGADVQFVFLTHGKSSYHNCLLPSIA